MKNVFKKAHEITRKIIRKGDSYRETFRLALIFVYSELKKGVSKMLDKKEIIEFKCEDTSKEFDSVVGKIYYEKNWGWRVELKEPRGQIIIEDLYKIRKELKAEIENCSEKDIYFVDGKATVRSKTVNTNKKEVNNSYEVKNVNVGKCWECGCELDRNGNCPVCGCSKEIYEF